MSISAIQQASRVIAKYEREDGTLTESEIASALIRLRAESLELFSAMAMVMFDEEIGKRAREIAEQAKKGKLTPVAASYIKSETEGEK